MIDHLSTPALREIIFLKAYVIFGDAVVEGILADRKELTWVLKRPVL